MQLLKLTTKHVRDSAENVVCRINNVCDEATWFYVAFEFVLRLIGHTSGLFYCKLSFTFMHVAEVAKGRTVRGRRSETRQDQKRCQEHGIAVSQRQLLRLGCKACSLIHTLQAVYNSIRIVPIKLALITPWGSQSSRMRRRVLYQELSDVSEEISPSIFRCKNLYCCVLTTNTVCSYETFVNLKYKNLGVTSQNSFTFIFSAARNPNLTQQSHHHHHHWLDSPWWALDFLRSFVHSSPLRATFFAMSSTADRSGFNFFRFRNDIFSRGGVVSPTPNPQQSWRTDVFLLGFSP